MPVQILRRTFWLLGDFGEVSRQFLKGVFWQAVSSDAKDARPRKIRNLNGGQPQRYEMRGRIE